MPSLKLGRPLLPGSRLPFLIEACGSEDDLLPFGVLHRDELEHLIQRHGALLLRGFRVDHLSFGDFVNSTFGSRLKYTFRSTPRRAIADRIYTSTVYPSDREIPLHCENSYQRDWPMRLAFYSVVAADSGGQTPLADMMRVTARIDSGILDRFRQHGVLYVRNYGAGIDLPWTEVFQTDDPREVERFCYENQIEVRWGSGDELSTRHNCRGTAIHPTLNVELWFNQVNLFHSSSLGADMERKLIDTLGIDRLPRNAFYGNGESIKLSDIIQIRESFAAETVTFNWNRGDVLLLDNMQVAHGRRSYMGNRLVLVSMSQPHSTFSSRAQSSTPIDQ